MKSTLLALFVLMASAPLFAQKNSEGEMRDGILYLNNGIAISKDNQLRLNGPSGEDSRFAYIFHAPGNFFDSINKKMGKKMRPYHANSVVTVRKIRYVKAKNGQEGKWILALRNREKASFLCDISGALRIGEISVEQLTPAVSQPVSVADELIKLKKLLDEGLITQEEFDALKKKLIK